MDSSSHTHYLARWELGRARSVLSEQRALGPAWRDLPRRYEAQTITSQCVPVQAVASVTIAGAPLLYFAEDRGAVVVDARYFSSLAVVDLTQLGAGEAETVGRVTPAGRAGLSGRATVGFLLHAGVLCGYAHIGAVLGLLSEREEEGTYSAQLVGRHVFFTQRRHERHYAFSFSITAGGELCVRGEEAR